MPRAGQFKPGQPATAGTRHGTGSGWGGSAKGAGGPPGGPGTGRPSGEAWAGKTTVAALLIEAGAQQTAAAAWLAIINDPAHPKHAEMIAKAAERMDGAPLQRLEVRDANPDEMTDAELEAIARRGRAPAD